MIQEAVTIIESITFLLGFVLARYESTCLTYFPSRLVVVYYIWSSFWLDLFVASRFVYLVGLIDDDAGQLYKQTMSSSWKMSLPLPLFYLYFAVDLIDNLLSQ